MNPCDDMSDNMIAYQDMYSNPEGSFDGYKASHISRSSNDEADMLANIRS
jgi:hypothetical protein